MKLKYILHVTVPELTCGRSVGSCLAPRKVFCIYLVLCDIMNIVTNTAVSGVINIAPEFDYFVRIRNIRRKIINQINHPAEGELSTVQCNTHVSSSKKETLTFCGL